MSRAKSLQATSPRAAAAVWANIESSSTRQHGFRWSTNGRSIFDFARVRNYQFHPYWGLIADQAWLS